jgi:hypothetical protein
MAEEGRGSDGWDSGLTPEQEAARAKLQALLDELTAPPGESAEAYVPVALAAVVTPWVEPSDVPAPAEQEWPGPPLPGEPLDVALDVTCVTARNEAASAVLAQAASATSATPWVSGDGTRWSLLFRPLLPHEAGCADLAG